MNPTIRLGRIFGVEIGLHYSWFIIALLILLSLSGHFHLVNPEWSAATIWGLAAITAVFFFASIVAHELSHATVAKARGMPVRSITLFALGGVANVEKESTDAKSEFLVAIVGPIASFLIGVFFLAIARAAGWHPASGTPTVPLWAALTWLGYINILLAVFNMIPGFPLDGGRVLRSIVWAINHNPVRATTIAANVGQFVAVAFIVSGIFRFFFTGAFGGLWLAFIGWFLADAAAASRAGVQVTAALGDVRVGDIAFENCPEVDGNLNLRTFAEDHLLRTGRRCFTAVQNGRRIGLVTISDLKRVERQRWPFTTVAEIARSSEQLHGVTPATSLVDALRLMAQEGVNQVPVVSGGRLVGVVSRDQIAQFMQTRQELKAA
jgi:Zn-dependent protease/predicted transcriptional regulator